MKQKEKYIIQYIEENILSNISYNTLKEENILSVYCQFIIESIQSLGSVKLLCNSEKFVTLTNAFYV